MVNQDDESSRNPSLAHNNSEYITHERRKIGNSLRKKIRGVTALVLIKCLKQIKVQRMLLTCAPFSELPSNIGIPCSYPAFDFNILVELY